MIHRFFLILLVPIFFSLKPKEIQKITYLDNKVKSRKSGLCGQWVYVSKNDPLELKLLKYGMDHEFFKLINGIDEVNLKYSSGYWWFSDIDQKECRKKLYHMDGEAKTYYPIDGKIRVSSEMGVRYIRRKINYHYGIDLYATVGTRVYSITEGIVTASLYSKHLGNFIVVKRQDGLKTLYAHLSRRFVLLGEKVEVGQQIGISGDTGNTTGPHLHIEMKLEQEYINPLRIF